MNRIRRLLIILNNTRIRRLLAVKIKKIKKEALRQGPRFAEAGGGIQGEASSVMERITGKASTLTGLMSTRPFQAGRTTGMCRRIFTTQRSSPG